MWGTTVVPRRLSPSSANRSDGAVCYGVTKQSRQRTSQALWAAAQRDSFVVVPPVKIVRLLHCA